MRGSGGDLSPSPCAYIYMNKAICTLTDQDVTPPTPKCKTKYKLFNKKTVSWLFYPMRLGTSISNYFTKSWVVMERKFFLLCHTLKYNPSTFVPDPTKSLASLHFLTVQGGSDWKPGKSKASNKAKF